MFFNVSTALKGSYCYICICLYEHNKFSVASVASSGAGAFNCLDHRSDVIRIYYGHVVTNACYLILTMIVVTVLY